MNVPYPQILEDLTHLQTHSADYQEVVNEGVLGQEYGIRRGKGKWNLRVTYTLYGGYTHAKSKTFARAIRLFLTQMGRRGNYADIPLKTDGDLFKTLPAPPAGVAPTITSRVYDSVEDAYTYTLNSSRSDIEVGMFLSVTYANHPRLLQVWH